MERVAVIDSSRIPFTRSFGKYLGIENKTMLLAAMEPLVQRLNLAGKEVGEVVAGAVMKHPRDWNMTRETVLASALSDETPAFDLQRACGTSLEAAVAIAHKIQMGAIDDGIAMGSDTNSHLAVVFPDRFVNKTLKLRSAKSLGERLSIASKFSFGDFKPVFPAVAEPTTGLSMGEHTELMAKTWQIAHHDQDQLALESHQKLAKAYEDGFISSMLTPFQSLDKDTILRADTSIEKLAKLRPAFDKENGTMTAGNSTALTDGAACAYLCSESFAQKNNLQPMAFLTMSQHAAVDFRAGEGLLMAPVKAVSRMLERSNLTLQDFDFYEIHEAFAAQVLCTLAAWDDEEYCRKVLGRDKKLGAIDRNKLNVTGSSLAVGHPFAATGARILGTAAKLLANKGQGRALISICTAGGMGVTAILER